MSEQKNNWDKFDFFARLFNILILGTIPIILGIGAQKVANSLQYGELVQKMISDLATPLKENPIHRDLALIALNRTIGDENPKMIEEISELIYLNDSASRSEINVAYKILREKNPKKADSLKNEAQRNLLVQMAESYIRISAISQTTANATDINPIPKIDEQNVQKFNQTFARAHTTIVFIQTNKDKEKLNGVIAELQKMGYQVPPVEIIKEEISFSNSIRYFNNEDASDAQKMAAQILQINPKWNCKVQKLNNPDNKVPSGQLEVWVYQK